MAVCVDGANFPAEVRDGTRVHRSPWSHLTAGTPEELHEFAARLGLGRQWLQPGRSIAGRPSPFWDHDLTSSTRAQAFAAGTVSMPSRELAACCRARDGRSAQPRGGVGSGRDEAASAARRRAGPDSPCPDCGTAEQAHGGGVCQACGLLRILATRQARQSGDPASPQIEAGS